MDQTTATIIISIAGIVISILASFIVATLKIGEYKNKVDQAIRDIGEIRKEEREIRDKVIACETSLKEREPLTKRKSPVTLSDRGNHVLTESKGKDFVDSNYEELKLAVEKTNPQTSYDIQESSRQIMDNLRDDARINPIKEYLFKEGMELEDIIVVLGIYLRDKILKEKGIEAKDIDKYIPHKG